MITASFWLFLWVFSLIALNSSRLMTPVAVFTLVDEQKEAAAAKAKARKDKMQMLD
jgi:hypothetical protein